MKTTDWHDRAILAERALERAAEEIQELKTKLYNAGYRRDMNAALVRDYSRKLANAMRALPTVDVI